MNKPNEFPPPVEQPLLEHLIELRDRLLRAVVAIIVVFLCLFAFANDLYTYLAEPLLKHMPEGTSMIATEVASPFLTPFKLSLVLSVFISVPFLLYQLWGFVAPALYKRERRLIYPLLISSTALFYCGMAFAYYVVFPLVFGFLTGIAPEGVSVMTDISRYLDFVLKMFFAFGLAFEVPIATILVIWSGMTTAENLAQKRPYIIVAAFVFGMLLTPPDVISQTLLALPMWILFEAGLILSKVYVADPVEDDEDDEPSISESLDIDNSAEGGLEYPDDYETPSEDEMDAELDRIEAEEEGQDDDMDAEPHIEYEPIEEERDREADDELNQPSSAADDKSKGNKKDDDVDG